MIYPKFIKENDTIGVTAPSDGVSNPQKLYRLDNAIKHFNRLGFKIKETPNVRVSNQGRSGTSLDQAREFQSLIENQDISAIICSGGGDFLLEILPYLDFALIKANPKWVQGYSDPTSLLFVITTMLDIATIYSDNFLSFGMNPWHQSLTNNLELLKGKLLTQNSFPKYEETWTTYELGDEPYNLTMPTYWKNITTEKTIHVTGRIIGGCLDVLTDLFGTRFDYTKNFLERYRQDGIIWYFDVCELTSESLIRILWKLKDNGWFQYTKCIIFGRIMTETSYYNITYEEAILHSLKDLNIPIIINTDIGHVAPRLSIINGSLANITSEKGKGSITFNLK